LLKHSVIFLCILLDILSIIIAYLDLSFIEFGHLNDLKKNVQVNQCHSDDTF